MFASLVSVRASLESAASSFEPGCLSGPQATQMVAELGAIRRLTDGLLAKAAKRVDDTYAYRDSGAKDAAAAVGKALGVSNTEAQRSIELAKHLEKRPATDAAMRAGRLSAHQAELIASAAAKNPAAEHKLIETAASGMVQLQDACLAARNAVEDAAARRKRQHRARTFHTWTDKNNGMFRGSFALTPEIGGQVKAVVDHYTQAIFRTKRIIDDREDHDRYAADAFTQLILKHANAEPRATVSKQPQSTESKDTSRVRRNVHVVIDHQVLTRGEALEGERCEIPGVGPVDAQWVRGILGEAFVTSIIGKGKDIRTVAHAYRSLDSACSAAQPFGTLAPFAGGRRSPGVRGERNGFAGISERRTQ